MDHAGCANLFILIACDISHAANGILEIVYMLTCIYILCYKLTYFNEWEEFEQTREDSKFFVNRKKQKERSLFQFQYIPKQTWVVLPFSLNGYATSLQDNRPTEETMKYEWGRYLSFQDFPQDSAATPLRLAQAGFYHTGHGEEVKCFSCGVTNSHWSFDETAIEVHKRLSPNCAFLHGQDSSNVPIHCRDYYRDIEDAMVQTDSLPDTDTATGAIGGPSDTHSTHGHTPPVTTSGGPIGSTKHPAYADETRRLSSFANWPPGPDNCKRKAESHPEEVSTSKKQRQDNATGADHPAMVDLDNDSTQVVAMDTALSRHMSPVTGTLSTLSVAGDLSQEHCAIPPDSESEE